MFSTTTACGPSFQAKYQPPVAWLAAKLRDDPVWKDAFEEALDKARQFGVEVMKPIATTEDYLNHIDHVLRTPFIGKSRRDFVGARRIFHFVLNQPPLKNWQSPVTPGDKPQKLTELSKWIVHYTESVGLYMDSPESAQDIENFKQHMGSEAEDFMAPPSGYFTFNQFFARHLRPGMRPIASMNDDSVIVSPADSSFMGWWRISSESKTVPEKLLDIKGLEWSIHQLLEGSEYQDAFAGGIFTHSYLQWYDYHRFHTPVAGRVLEKKNIQGQCYLETRVRDGPDGKEIEHVDGMGYQFVQTRGLVVIDSPIGLVACIPVGMSQVASVILTPNEGAYLHKGEELGYFQFGGSDFVMIFQEKADMELYCKTDVWYRMGTAVGKAHGFFES